MLIDKNTCFVIYGGGSDLIRPIYSRYQNSSFIPIIKNTNVSFKNGNLVSTKSENWLEELKNLIELNYFSENLVYINAATFQLEKLFTAHSEEEIEAIVKTGISNQLLISKIMLGQMIKKKVGRFINLSSFRSKLPINGTSLYSSIKSFNNIFFKSIGLEYGRFDITSNSISIGFADTKLLKNLPKESIQKYKKSIVKNRFLDEDEFFNCVEYIIQSNYLNGAIINLDGGLKVL